MRILHTMLRTGNLDRPIDFYTQVLGMKLLRRQDYPEGKFTLAFIGYGDEKDNSVIELTYNGASRNTRSARDTATSPSKSMMCMPPAKPSAKRVARSFAKPAP